MKTKLYLICPEPNHNNYGYKIWGDSDLISKFSDRCHDLFFRSNTDLHAFWQGGYNDEDFKYIEFLCGIDPVKQDRIFHHALELVKEFDLELVII